MSGYFVRTVVVGANITSKVFAQSLAVGARSTQNPEMKTVQKAPARSPPSPRSARDEPAFASLTQTPADGPARSLRRRRAAPTARMTAGLPAVAVRAGTAEVLRIEDSPQPENLRFSRTSFATFTKTPPAPIGVAQTTTQARPDGPFRPPRPLGSVTGRFFDGLWDRALSRWIVGLGDSSVDCRTERLLGGLSNRARPRGWGHRALVRPSWAERLAQAERCSVSYLCRHV
jgi:hypothetical protein